MILKSASVQWWTILAVDSIRDMATLQLQVMEHKEALAYSVMGNPNKQQYATIEDLQAVKNSLSRLGVRTTLQRKTYYSAQWPNSIVSARVGEAELEEVEETPDDNDDETKMLFVAGTLIPSQAIMKQSLPRPLSCSNRPNPRH